MKMAKNEKLNKLLMSPFGGAAVVSLLMAIGIWPSMNFLFLIILAVLGLFAGWKNIKGNEEMKALIVGLAFVVVFGVYKFATTFGNPALIFLDNFLTGIAAFGAFLIVIPALKMLGSISKN